MLGRTPQQPLRREVLGRYQLVERVAVGGMAELYLARVTGPGGFSKNVAVKRVLPQLAESDDMFDMLLDEARIAATLQHPNLVQVYDVCEENGEFFIAMEFLDGIDLQSLSRLLDEKKAPLPWEIALFILTGVASGLQYAHDKTDIDGTPLGIVHRDVTPHNIFLTRDGGVKLVDFGIAKAANRLAETSSGTVKGKVPYMSPEQCLGQPIDHRADIFALGILLYELTTRRRLYDQRSEYLLMQQIVEGRIVPPSKLMKYSPELEAVVLRALAKEPSDRFASAREFQSQLEYYAQTRNMRMSALELQNFLRPLLRDYEATRKPPLAEGSNRARLRHATGTETPTPNTEREGFASLPWSAGARTKGHGTPLPPPGDGEAAYSTSSGTPQRRRAGDRLRCDDERSGADRDTQWASDLVTSAPEAVTLNAPVAGSGPLGAAPALPPSQGLLPNRPAEATPAPAEVPAIETPDAPAPTVPVPETRATLQPVDGADRLATRVEPETPLGRHGVDAAEQLSIAPESETRPLPIRSHDERSDVAALSPFADLPSIARAAIAEAYFDEEAQTAPVDPAVLRALAEAEPIVWQPEAPHRGTPHTIAGNRASSIAIPVVAKDPRKTQRLDPLLSSALLQESIERSNLVQTVDSVLQPPLPSAPPPWPGINNESQAKREPQKSSEITNGAGLMALGDPEISFNTPANTPPRELRWCGLKSTPTPTSRRLEIRAALSESKIFAAAVYIGAAVLGAMLVWWLT